MRGKKYWISYFHKSIRIRKSLKTSDHKYANYLKNDIENKISLGVLELHEIKYLQKKMRDMPWLISRWGNMNSKEKQAVIFAVYEGKCFHCGKDINLLPSIDRKQARKTMMVMDHIIPFSCGGSDMPHNMAASCHECNTKRSDKDIEKFSRKSLVI